MRITVKDAALYDYIAKEVDRQNNTLSLIASENYASDQVMQATGSCLTNKYAEGYPTKRYYAGCEIVDEIESIAIARAKELFKAEHANVQPHAGSQANMGVYFAALKPGDTIMGMSLSEGGHLTHGHAVNFSGSLYNVVRYSVDPETELIDYHKVRELVHVHKPKLIIAGASAYSRIIDFEQFASIAQEVGALFMADIAHIAGLVVTNLHPSPFPSADFVTTTTHKTLRGPRGGLILCKKQWADKIDRAIMPGIQGGPFMNSIAAKAVGFFEAAHPTFTDYCKQIIANAQAMASTFQELGYRIVAGGTDNHLFILDLRSKKITGKHAEFTLEKAGITVSRSTIPFDPEKPAITSGIRIGTPAMTTRGLKEKHAQQLAYLIDQILINHDKETVLQGIKEQVQRLCMEFRVY